VTHRLVARLDNVGDVLLAGPAVRAVAASGEPVYFLAGPAGAPAARLLPDVQEVLTFDAPWVSFDPPPVDNDALAMLIDRVRGAGISEAIILTSFHQSPLPLALLLREAGVGSIAATSTDYPGSLLDHRLPHVDELHEVEQALTVCAAGGHVLPGDDDGRLRIDVPAPTGSSVVSQASVSGAHVPDPYVVVHPGASVESRALPPARAADAVEALVQAGYTVAVTGTAHEKSTVERVVGGSADHSAVRNLAGATDLAEFARLVAGAAAVVCGNTAAAHVAAAVGTPVVEAFAPVVPPHRWRPWRVPHVLLGTLDIACRDCRARQCPVSGQPCLDPFTGPAVVDAVTRLARDHIPTAGASRS
jgi:ADP-heptose:LPS heptosyltransferase